MRNEINLQKDDVNAQRDAKNVNNYLSLIKAQNVALVKENNELWEKVRELTDQLNQPVR